jgi:UDP-N-acetylmuramyl pentapeptide phosphotransferase/UDP-N-acetylglucosamine-1-phosphate transferase
MNKAAIILAFILYVVIAIGNFRQKDYPHFLIWLCYAGSQLGFLWWELVKEEMP